MGGARASQRDLIHQVDDVAFFDLMNAFVGPARADLSAQPVGHDSGTAQVSNSLLNVGFKKVSDLIDNDPAPGLALLGSWIAAFEACREYFLRLYSRHCERHAAVRANRELAQLRSSSSDTIEHN